MSTLMSLRTSTRYCSTLQRAFPRPARSAAACNPALSSRHRASSLPRRWCSTRPTTTGTMSLSSDTDDSQLLPRTGEALDNVVVRALHYVNHTLVARAWPLDVVCEVAPKRLPETVPDFLHPRGLEHVRVAAVGQPEPRVEQQPPHNVPIEARGRVQDAWYRSRERPLRGHPVKARPDGAGEACLLQFPGHLLDVLIATRLLNLRTQRALVEGDPYSHLLLVVLARRYVPLRMAQRQQRVLQAVADVHAVWGLPALDHREEAREPVREVAP
eukprot:768817-Hanusia_phi.AAC.10